MKATTLARIGLLGVLVVGLVSPVHAKAKPKCTPVPVDLGLTATAPGGTGLGDFPVFVHYMINEDHPTHDPSVAPPTPSGTVSSPASYPPALLQSHFSPKGLFNTIWSDQGITFVLVGIETCKYNVRTLDPTFSTNREPFPNPGNAPNLALAVFKRYHASHYQVGTGVRPFKGLDLYLFWGIEDVSGYGTSPKFKTLASGAQAIRTKGGAFLDGDCQDPTNDPPGPAGDGCRRAFAHEAGHFLALCHCCNTGLGTITQVSTCTTSYCPDVATAGATVPDCSSSTSYSSRLMATNWGHDGLTSCEIMQATGTALLILQ